MKGIERNKLAVVIKWLLWEFDLYCKYMCTGKNYNKNKKSRTSPLSQSSGYHSSYSISNCWETT